MFDRVELSEIQTTHGVQGQTRLAGIDRNGSLGQTFLGMRLRVAALHVDDTVSFHVCGGEALLHDPLAFVRMDGNAPRIAVENLHYHHAAYGGIDWHVILSPGVGTIGPGTIGPGCATAASSFVPEHCKNSAYLEKRFHFSATPLAIAFVEKVIFISGVCWDGGGIGLFVRT